MLSLNRLLATMDSTSPMEQTLSVEHPLLSAPQFLRDWPAWAAWTAPIKMPLDLRRALRRASVTDPDSWAPFPPASLYLRKAAAFRAPSLPLAQGVGILITPPLVFIDFDDLIEEEDTTPPKWAHDFLLNAGQIGAYTEWSGSGSGAHALIRTSEKCPPLSRNRYTRMGLHQPVGVEIYAKERFAALTGFPYADGARPQLNDPTKGDDLVRAFISELGFTAAPVISPPVGPIEVPYPSDKVQAAARHIAEDSFILSSAFNDPDASFQKWAAKRQLKGADDSLSAWRHFLYSEASRHSPASPQPVYELFNPQATPATQGVLNWQEYSGYLKKKHRVYRDIQRAHARAVEEDRLLAQSMGTPVEVQTPEAAPPEETKRKQPDTASTQSWAQLGLVMKVTDKGGAYPMPCSANYIRILSKHKHFKTYRIERCTLDGATHSNRQPAPDTLATRLLEPIRAIMDMSTDPPIEAVRGAIEVVADDNSYDPLVEYLKTLPAYDPEEPSHLSTWLEEIGATPDHDIQLYSRRILLGLVARALAPKGVKFDYVPVFEGPTGIGKSSLVAAIVSPEFYATFAESFASKDAAIALRGKWGVELAEMSSFRKSDEETRKAFISTPSDWFRPVFGRANINVTRRAVLFGTTEDKQYLTDYRGARRYWPIRFDREIDIPKFLTMRDRLFAEAVYQYEQGERFHDTMEEMHAPERMAALESKLVTPAWQVRLMDFLAARPTPYLPKEDGDGFCGLLSTQYITNQARVLDLPQLVQNMSDSQLASFLRRAGYTSKVFSYRQDSKSKKLYGWAHPALQKLSDEQLKAFLSAFPALFGGEAPPAWTMLQEGHLAMALHWLETKE